MTTRPESLRTADPTWYQLETCSPAVTVAPASPVVPPDFVARRSDLPLCGYELSRDQPNALGRRCLRDAVVNGSPAEFVFVNPNAMGRPVTYWQRTTGTGVHEVLVHYQPQADTPSRTWVRMECKGFSILESASPVVQGIGCRNVESVQTSPLGE